jgi:hypothetical protein
VLVPGDGCAKTELDDDTEEVGVTLRSMEALHHAASDIVPVVEEISIPSLIELGLEASIAASPCQSGHHYAGRRRAGVLAQFQLVPPVGSGRVHGLVERQEAC